MTIISLCLRLLPSSSIMNLSYLSIRSNMTAKKELLIKKKPAKAKKAQKQSPVFKSFRLSKDSNKFITFKLTKQTLYWTILLIYILFMDVWIANAQINAILATT